jgi:Ser/Thr protein kinase RdoA (MazF antagonist)
MASEPEVPLAGGIRHAQTVRAGNTVRKPAGPWTPAVHALLDHLVTRGFPAPKPLGIDEKGREILSYIEGRASIWPWPEFFKRSEAVEHVGKTLRRYHDLVADFVPPNDAVWQDCDRAMPLPGEIICHCDFGPYNLVWANENIVGVVDWEWARPAPATRDLAYAIWMTVPLRTDEDADAMGYDHTPHAWERIKAFLAGYGFVDRTAVLQAVLALQREYRAKIENLGAAGKEPWKTFRDIKLHERNMRDHAWLRANLDMLLRDP